MNVMMASIIKGEGCVHQSRQWQGLWNRSDLTENGKTCQGSSWDHRVYQLDTVTDGPKLRFGPKFFKLDIHSYYLNKINYNYLPFEKTFTITKSLTDLHEFYPIFFKVLLVVKSNFNNKKEVKSCIVL